MEKLKIPHKTVDINYIHLYITVFATQDCYGHQSSA